MKEIIHASVEKLFGSTILDKTYEPVEKHFLGLRSSLSEILSVFQNGNFSEIADVKQVLFFPMLEFQFIFKVFPPMLERAHLRKQAAAEAEGLRWQLDKKDSEMQELRKTIKSRNEDIGSYKVQAMVWYNTLNII